MAETERVLSPESRHRSWPGEKRGRGRVGAYRPRSLGRRFSTNAASASR